MIISDPIFDIIDDDFLPGSRSDDPIIIDGFPQGTFHHIISSLI
jgi:hypothetical protein